ncbi:MAG: hypothetical protein AAF806_29425 [Bacteroidota bacterium]
MRRISFALTKRQVEEQTKTVTRRNGWKWLKVGSLLQPIEKGMGLKKGEKQVLIGLPIQVLFVNQEPLNQITQAEVIKEGFPDWTPEQFVAFYAKHNNCREDHEVTRIEFKYLTIRELPEDLLVCKGFMRQYPHVVYDKSEIERYKENDYIYEVIGYTCTACEEAEEEEARDIELDQKQWEAYRIGAEIKDNLEEQNRALSDTYKNISL